MMWILWVQLAAAGLLKALKSIVERGDANGMQNWPIMKQARAAIAKATGA